MLKMGITIIKPDYNENFITLRKVFMQNIISVICCILMISYFSLGYAADIPTEWYWQRNKNWFVK